MRLARPAHSLLGRCLSSTRAATPLVPCRRPFQTSAPRAKRRPRFRNVKAEELGLLEPSKMAEYRRDKFPEYSDEEKAELRRLYNAQQVEAIEAGEQAVKPEDLVIQGRLRDDAYAPNYMDDFATLDPRYDVKPEMEVTPREPVWLNHDDWVDKYGKKMLDLTQEKTSDQLKRAMVRALRRVKDSDGQEELIDLTDEELDELEKDPDLLRKYIVEEEEEGKKGDGPPKPAAEADLTAGQMARLDKALDAAWNKEVDLMAKEAEDSVELKPTALELRADGPAGAERVYSAEAHELGKVPGVAGLYNISSSDKDRDRDDTGSFDEIKRLTGFDLVEIESIYRKVLVQRNVSNQTRLGKVRSSSILAIAGNGNGWLGLGSAKSTDLQVAIVTAQFLAIRNMKPIRRYEKRTIYGNVKAKVSGTIVELFARPPGFGLRCPHRIFEMCRASGLHDISARMPRSKNPMNSVKAAYQALLNQPDPEEIAIGRGRKLVDVRKVYYGGAVL
ncbi:hypothetical protein CDD83_4032 [Cordyceps sp. RAO-2017]|nr:hypothetical protein CDD83_4032 [Cordyceps sp. RAO-2017]